jgi:hypothetical protein
VSLSEVAAVGVCLRLQAVKIGLEGQVVQEVGNLKMLTLISQIRIAQTYGLCKPTGTARFKPAQMSSKTRCEKDSIGVLLELLIRNSLLDSNLCMVRTVCRNSFEE